MMSCICVVSIIFVSILVSFNYIVNGQVNCYNASQCKSATLSTSSTIYCLGYGSCDSSPLQQQVLIMMFSATEAIHV